MRLRILVFLILQIVAWSLYFKPGNETTAGSQNTLQVREIKGDDSENAINEIDSYRLVLRNDGLFSKMIEGQIVESGLWSVNYDIPSLILKSPLTEYKFKIVKFNGADLEIMLINQHELRNITESGSKKSMEKLFSTIRQ